MSPAQSNGERRARRPRVVVLLAAIVAAAALSVPINAALAGTREQVSAAMTFAATLPALPSTTATVTISAQIGQDFSAAGVPQTILEQPLATTTVSSTDLSVPVPRSPFLSQAEAQGHGIVNFLLTVVSGNDETTQFVPAALTAGAGSVNAQEAAAREVGRIGVPAFPAFRSLPATPQVSAPTTVPGNGWCYLKAYGPETQDRTRIGEVHVADVSGVTDTFWFKNQNDQTMTVGISDNGPDGAYGGDGTITLTNTLSANGYHVFGPGAVQYIDDTTNYQKYQVYQEYFRAGCRATNTYVVEAVNSDGDVYPGIEAPPGNPWGGCAHDPLHVTLVQHSGWERDQSQAEFYSAAATVLGFTFGGSDGFTQDVEHDYVAAPNARTTYICGYAIGQDPTHAPILYNTP